MKEHLTPKSVNISIGGDVSGQIVVGNHNLTIGGIYGGIVNFITPGKQPTFSPRPKPVTLRPRAFAGMLDREAEQMTAVNTLRISESLSISGENGIGKTALMRYLAYNSPGDNFPDGIIYLSAQGCSVDDLRQYIFESFFESDIALKPTEAQLIRSLQGLRALILFDDLSLSYAEVNELLNGVPQSNFILSSASRCLWGEGGCIELGGLPIKDAFTLLERELGHAINEQDKATAEAFCHAAHGNPLTVLQAAGLIHHGATFAQILASLQESHDQFIKNILTSLTASQRQVLFLLAASEGQPIPTKHLAAMTQDSNLETTLKTLIDLKLIQSHSPAYSLTGTLAVSIEKLTDLGSWQERVLNYFAGWIKQNPPLPDITNALNLLLNLLERSNREHRWDDVITFGRGIEKALTLTKRWSAWLHVLEMIRNAAQALGNRALQGWALHQLGTRELCLGNLEAAKEILKQALNIRTTLGDKEAAAVTQHNLDLIIAPPAPPRDTPQSGPKPAPKGGGSPLLKVFFGVIFTIGVIAAIILLLPYIYPPDTNGNGGRAPISATTKAPVEKPTKPPPTDVPANKTEPPPPTDVPETEPRTETCAPGIWYCENFEDGYAQFWDLSPAWSIQKDGTNYLLAGSGHEWATLTEHEWDDFRVKFDLRLWQGTIHLNYRIKPVGNSVVRYYVGISDSQIYLKKSSYPGGAEDLISKNIHYPLGEWQTVEIASWKGHIVVYINGKLTLNHFDKDYLPSGSIAFETLDNSKAQIDNIEVMEAGEEPPPDNGGTGDIGVITGANICVVQGKIVGVERRL
jgi:hypothetical protein